MLAKLSVFRETRPYAPHSLGTVRIKSAIDRMHAEKVRPYPLRCFHTDAVAFAAKSCFGASQWDDR